MNEPGALVRLAAFKFLEDHLKSSDDGQTIRRAVLEKGFEYNGQRVPLVGPQGIFKPRLIPNIPLSITTVAIVDGEDRPYDDAFGVDGLLRYRYRGQDPNHHDNVGLREAMRRQVPLVYFHGIVPGLYVAEWPVYVVGDHPATLTFTVSVEERRFASLGTVWSAHDEVDIRRHYATRVFRQRLHQREFRERVVRAYLQHCAICRLRRTELLEAAHIVPDSDPIGEPKISNGVALCRLHHGAFDANLIGITPDYLVTVRQDVLDDSDGPMLVHGLQGFHGAKLWLPKNYKHYPDQGLLEMRYANFRAAGK
jgi:putative restriction endonuclease